MISPLSILSFVLRMSIGLFPSLLTKGVGSVTGHGPPNCSHRTCFLYCAAHFRQEREAIVGKGQTGSREPCLRCFPVQLLSCSPTLARSLLSGASFSVAGIYGGVCKLSVSLSGGLLLISAGECYIVYLISLWRPVR